MSDPPAFPDEDELPDDPPDLSEITVFEEDPSEYDDINEFVTDEWSQSKTARQRVKDVIVRTTQPRPTAEVAELADVSPPTARSELSELAEEGVVSAESTENGRIYQRDPDWHRIKRIRELAEKPHAALEATLQRLEREIERYTAEYEVDTPEDLILSDGALSDTAWSDISHWRTALVEREYIRTALQYAKLRRSEELLFDNGGDSDEELTAP